MSEIESEYRADFSVGDVVMKVRELAAANPHFVYQAPQAGSGTCLYVHAAPITLALLPGCLMGQALHALGVPLELLRDRCERTGIRRVLGILGVPMSVSKVTGSLQEADWLSSVQYNQDSGCSWGKCVEIADHEYPLDSPDDNSEDTGSSGDEDTGE